MARPRGGEEVNLFVLSVENMLIVTMLKGNECSLHHVARPPLWTHGNMNPVPLPGLADHSSTRS